MECPACHTPNVDGARFCAKCGALLPTAAPRSRSADRHDRRRSLPHHRRSSARAAWAASTPASSRWARASARSRSRRCSRSTRRIRRSLARFMRECGTVSELEHPNTIKVYDFGQTDAGELYIAMELLDGQVARDGARARAAACRPSASTRSSGRSAARSRRRTTRGSSTAISSPRTSSSRRARAKSDFVKVLDFGIAKRDEKPTRSRAEAHAAGHGARHAAVHEPRAVHRARARRAQRHLLARRR